MMGLLSVPVDNAGIEFGVEMTGTEFAAERIEPDVEHTAAELDADTDGTEAECVERMVIVVDMGFVPGSAAAISAISAAPGAASVGVQVAAVPSFVDAASVARSFVAPDVLAFPAVAVLLASAVPVPSAAAAPVAAAEVAFAAPSSAVVQAAADAGTVVVAVESVAAVADASAGATAVATGAALVAVGSSQT